jgi:hypothetical protein
LVRELLPPELQALELALQLAALELLVSQQLFVRQVVMQVVQLERKVVQLQHQK